MKLLFINVLLTNLYEIIEEMFPKGQKKLLINNKVPKKEGIAYSLAGGFCSELEEPSGEEGSYSGGLREELVGGELGV